MFAQLIRSWHQHPQSCGSQISKRRSFLAFSWQSIWRSIYHDFSPLQANVQSVVSSRVDQHFIRHSQHVAIVRLLRDSGACSSDKLNKDSSVSSRQRFFRVHAVLTTHTFHPGFRFLTSRPFEVAAILERSNANSKVTRKVTAFETGTNKKRRCVGFEIQN